MKDFFAMIWKIMYRSTGAVLIMFGVYVVVGFMLAAAVKYWPPQTCQPMETHI
jgi:hypothetical protein